MIAKAPSSMESIVQLYSTILTDSTPSEQEDKLDPKKIALAMRDSWETHGRAGMSRSNQQRVNKLSAVKPAGNQPPQFQYQQQHGGWGLSGILQNPAHFAQFLLSFLTYVLLSYFVHLHCANIHTPLLFFVIFTAQNIKTRNSNLLGAREDH